jgi:hypothetical protein
VDASFHSIGAPRRLERRRGVREPRHKILGNKANSWALQVSWNGGCDFRTLLGSLTECCKRQEEPRTEAAPYGCRAGNRENPSSSRKPWRRGPSWSDDLISTLGPVDE